MSTSPSRGQHTARKTAARDLSARTGMPYAAALRQVTRASGSWEPQHRWIITNDLRDWLDGRTWRGVGYPDLRAWLDNEVSPAFDCDWCDEPGDARDEDCYIELLVTEYDPDIQPATMHIGTRKLHARCKPARDASPIFGRAGAEGSSIAWLRKVMDIPPGPQRIGLPASARPDTTGEFELEARALLAPGWWYGHDHTGQAMLLVTARVTEDNGQGARPWLTELELHLNSEDLGHPDSVEGGEYGWALQVVTGARPWIALRTVQDDDGTFQHLLIQQLHLPDGWADAARRDGQVTIAAGPCTVHLGTVTAGPPQGVADELDEVRALGEDEEECVCAALMADHVAELIASRTLVTGGVRVTVDEQT